MKLLLHLLATLPITTAEAERVLEDEVRNSTLLRLRMGDSEFASLACS